MVEKSLPFNKIASSWCATIYIYVKYIYVCSVNVRESKFLVYRVFRVCLVKFLSTYLDPLKKDDTFVLYHF